MKPVIASLLLCLVACKTTPQIINDLRRSPISISAPEIQGVWYAPAYGQMAAIKDGTFRYFELTDTVCVEVGTTGVKLSDWFNRYRLSHNQKTLFLSDAEEPYAYQFRREVQIPPHCIRPVENSPQRHSPQENFDVFAASLSEYYPFFDLYNIDWGARVAEGQTQIDADMSGADLFRVLTQMLSGVKDAHIKLIAQIDGERFVHKGNVGKTINALSRNAHSENTDLKSARLEHRRKFWTQDLQTTLHDGNSRIVANDAIQYGIVSGDIGMISLRRMYGFGQDDETELEALHAALDEALAHFNQKNVKAVIINLALNSGGYDYVGRALASRFAERPVKAYSKKSANDPYAQHFTYTIQPSARERYTGPVYLLTSDITVSAAETATMAFRALPNVTHTGEATRGALSDILPRTLPNGWDLSLSSEIYLDSHGKHWEGKGIAPEINIPVFSAKDPNHGFVDAVDRLTQIIDRRLSIN